MNFKNDCPIKQLHIIIYTNGNVSTYTDTGIVVDSLSGKLPILHELVNFKNAQYRRDWYETIFGIARTPDVKFSMCIIGDKGDRLITQDIFPEQIQELIRYIKKR